MQPTILNLQPTLHCNPQCSLSNVTVPVEVIPYAANILLNCHLPAILPPPASFALRHSAAGKGKAGPVVTDNGNLVIDARLGDDRLFDDCDELERRLRRHAGVVGTGIFMVPSGTIVFEGDENTFEL